MAGRDDKVVHPGIGAGPRPHAATSARSTEVDRRRQLVIAARALFTSRAYDQVTTTDIAREAGVAYGLIGHHFGNKRGIYQAVLEDIASEIADRHTAPTPTDTSPRDRLRAVLHGHVKHVASYSTSFVTFVRGSNGVDVGQQRAIDEFRALGIGTLLDELGVTDPPEVLGAALRGWASFMDELIVEMIERDQLTVDQVTELTMATLIALLRRVSDDHPNIATDNVLALVY